MFYGFVITEAGNRLLAKMVAGQTLELSGVVMDKGTADSPEEARLLTAPITPGPAGTSTVPTVEGSTARMTVEYRSDLNGGLAAGFWIAGFGIYAKEPDTGESIVTRDGAAIWVYRKEPERQPCAVSRGEVAMLFQLLDDMRADYTKRIENLTNAIMSGRVSAPLETRSGDAITTRDRAEISAVKIL